MEPGGQAAGKLYYGTIKPAAARRITPNLPVQHNPYAVSLDPKGDLIYLTTTDKLGPFDVHEIRLRDERSLRKVAQHERTVRRLLVAPRGEVLATVSGLGAIIDDAKWQPPVLSFFDLRGSTRPVRTVEITFSSAAALTFSPDGETFAVGTAGGAIYLDRVSSTQAQYKVTDSLVMSGDPSSVDEESASLYDKPRAHVDSILGLHFVTGGRALLSLSETEARLWDVAAREEIGVILCGDQQFVSMDVSPDGRWAALGKSKGGVELWAMPPP